MILIITIFIGWKNIFDCKDEGFPDKIFRYKNWDSNNYFTSDELNRVPDDLEYELNNPIGYFDLVNNEFVRLDR